MENRWTALVALATANVALIIDPGLAVGADQTKIPTQLEIEGVLKARGLPTVAPRITLQTITFEFGSAVLTPASIKTLDNLGSALTQGLKDEKAFLIEGHTDR